jgi:hypothetical protein
MSIERIGGQDTTAAAAAQCAMQEEGVDVE